MKGKCPRHTTRTDLLQRLRMHGGHKPLQKISWGTIFVTIEMFGMSKRPGLINNWTPKKENQATQLKHN